MNAPFLFLLLACQSPTAPAPAPEAPEPAGHEEHEHGEEEASDLDQAEPALLEQSCEHGMPTHDCEECRYEVGVVKVPSCLVEGGLLQVEKAQTRPVEVPLRLTGEIQFDERLLTHVTVLTEGTVRRALVSLGDRVRAGQPLLELASNGVGEAQATYLEVRSSLELARRNLERIQALRREGITSEREQFEAQQAADALAIRVDAALDTLVRMGIPVEEAQAVTASSPKGLLVVRAPASGTVLNMHAVPGEVAHTEESLITLGDSRNLWVWADLYDQDVARVVQARQDHALSARVSVRAWPGEEFPGTVDFVSPSMDPQSRTVKVRVAVPNEGGRLFAGMFADVDIFLPGAEEVVAVPAGAVLQDGGRSFFFRPSHEDYWIRRPVTPGRTFGGWTEIVEGVEAGTPVVADGSFLLKSDVLRSKMGAGCAD